MCRCPIQLLQIGPILVQQFYCLFLCKTPRDFAEVYAPRMYNFGWGYPIPVFIFVVVLVYSIISPLILVFGVIYFAMSYLVCKYQLTYGKHIHKYVFFFFFFETNTYQSFFILMKSLVVCGPWSFHVS